VPLPKGLTTHKLRHAFASVLIALGEDPVSVMRQIGHTDPEFRKRPLFGPGKQGGYTKMRSQPCLLPCLGVGGISPYDRRSSTVAIGRISPQPDRASETQPPLANQYLSKIAGTLITTPL
jgi:hypothetical protein